MYPELTDGSISISSATRKVVVALSGSATALEVHHNPICRPEKKKRWK